MPRRRQHVNGRPAASFDLAEFVFGPGKADLESLDLAEPALALRFGDAGREVVPDLLKPGSLLWVWP